MDVAPDGRLALVDFGKPKDQRVLERGAEFDASYLSKFVIEWPSG